ETQAGKAPGTPPYISPGEAAGRVGLLGPARGVYSLGGNLYCFVAGEAPLRDKTPGGGLQKGEGGGFSKPSQVNLPFWPAEMWRGRGGQAGVLQALEAICLKAMALHPGDRYPSPRALADDLEHWLAEEALKKEQEALKGEIEARKQA